MNPPDFAPILESKIFGRGKQCNKFLHTEPARATAAAMDNIDRSLARNAELSLHDILKTLNIELYARPSGGNAWMVGIRGALHADIPFTGTSVMSRKAPTIDEGIRILCTRLEGQVLVFGAEVTGRPESELRFVKMPERVIPFVETP